MIERERAIALAHRVLDRPNADPDDDVAVLARQLLRSLELVYIPGHLHCDRCNFRLVSSTLHLADGAITARNTAEICPNDATPMRRVTYREDLEGAFKFHEEQVARAVSAEQSLEIARQALNRLKDGADLAIAVAPQGTVLDFLNAISLEAKKGLGEVAS